MIKKIVFILLANFLIITNLYAQPYEALKLVPEVQMEPPVKPITFQIGLLKIEAEFVAEGGTSSYKGYVLKRSDVALLQTVVDSLPDDFSRECDARIDACLEEVTSCQEDCNGRTDALIIDLTQTKEELQIERENHASTRMRYTFYGFGGALVSSLTTALILRIVK